MLTDGAVSAAPISTEAPMRIQLLQALSSVRKHYEAGRIVDWEDTDAMRLIERGVAIPALAEKATKPIAGTRIRRAK